jgi:hypothetical protein
LLCKPVGHEALAISPSFGYHELKNTIHNIVDAKCVRAIKGTDISKCLGNASTGNQSIDMAAVDYFSDGNALNATLWLLSKGSPNQTTSYGMYIDADSNIETGLSGTGIDYQLRISQENGNWNKALYQFSSNQEARILNNPENYTDFIKRYEKYITLSLDLGAIGFPEKYKVLFYSEEDEKQVQSKLDFTSWVDIPPQKLILSTIPSDISLRPGEGDTFGIQITSTSGLPPETFNFKAKENSTNFELSFISNEFHKFYHNTEPALFEIKVPEDAIPGTYSIPILANVSKTIGVYPYVSIGSNIQEINLPVTVLKRMTVGEELNDFNQRWISPLSGIYTFLGGLFTGGLSRLLFGKLTGR